MCSLWISQWGFFSVLQCHYIKVQWAEATYFAAQKFNIAINWCRKQARSTCNGFVSESAVLPFELLHFQATQWVLHFYRALYVL